MGHTVKTCDQAGYHDICFILDESGSIDEDDWNEAIDFLLGFVDSCEIGREKTQIAFVTFSTWPRFHFCCNDY
jgi:hypothetical protein